MWKCHKCGKPVYFAERKQSLGYDWHPECLRCEECGKRLNPGQHAEHKGVPYCHVPCYGALFGPQLFGHGTRVESHKNFGQKGTQRAAGGPCLPRDHMESKVKLYNEFFDNKSMEIRTREVNNRLILEGALRVYWGVQAIIHLKEDVDQRPVVIVRKRNSCRLNGADDDVSDKENDESESGIETTTSSAMDGYSTDISLSESMTFDSCSLSEDTVADISSTEDENSPVDKISATLPTKLDIKDVAWDEIDDLLQVERKVETGEKIYKTMPSPRPSQSSSDSSTPKLLSAQDSIESNSDPKSDQLEPNTFSEGTEEEEEEPATLKPMDFEDFKKSVHLEYVNGANSFPEINDDTLKRNQPIDPSRINDSLKLYGSQDIMSKSFNCEAALRTIDASLINDTLTYRDQNNRNSSPSKQRIPLQKSGSASVKNSPFHGRSIFEKGINRSKSGPNCFGYTDSDEDVTLKPSTIRRNEIKYVNLRPEFYSNNQSDGETSRATETNSFSAAGELTSEATNTEQQYVTEDGVVLRRRPKTGSTAIKRRSGNKRTRTKLKRRCSINGHFYNRETSFFTPPYGSQMSVWVTSLVNTTEVINLILEKYKVDSRPENFALFVVRDNGEQRRLKDDDYPLVTQVLLGPHEDVSRLFLMDSQATIEISSEVAQFLNLSIPECRAILDRYNDELEREIAKVKNKYEEIRHRIIQRMESLKVRL